MLQPTQTSEGLLASFFPWDFVERDWWEAISVLSFAVPGSPPLHVKSSLEGECFSSCHQMERPSQEQSQSLVWMSWEEASPPVWVWGQEKDCKVRVTCIRISSIFSKSFFPLYGGMLVMQNEKQLFGHGAQGFKVWDLLKMGKWKFSEDLKI